MTLDDMLSTKRQLLARAEKISKGGREFETDEVRREFDALLDRIEALNAELMRATETESESSPPMPTAPAYAAPVHRTEHAEASEDDRRIARLRAEREAAWAAGERRAEERRKAEHKEAIRRTERERRAAAGIHVFGDD